METIVYYFLSIVGISGSVVWLGKLIINKSFDFGLENYRTSLAKDLESHKFNLSRISLEHQIKFTKLHDERGEKIKNLYLIVLDLEKSLIFATTYLQGPNYTTDHERDNLAREKIKELIEKLDYDRIYFSVQTLEKFNAIIRESWEIVHTMAKVRHYGKRLDDYNSIGRIAPEVYYSQGDLWDEVNDRTEKKFKILKEQLADEFRELLGITSANTR